MSICDACGQIVPEETLTSQVDVVIRAKIASGVVVTRGHIHQWVTKVLDDYYSENTYDAVESGDLINVSIARQETNHQALVRQSRA
jgi:hypothetical protein